MEDYLKANQANDSDSETTVCADADESKGPTVKVKLGVHIASHVLGLSTDVRDQLVHEEVLLSWDELLKKFDFCFPDVVSVPRKTSWEVYQHVMQEGKEGKRYHYWGTDTRYVNSSRAGLRRRRDMIRVSLRGQHLCEIVCFVKARFPRPDTPDKMGERVGVLVRWSVM